MKYYCKRIFVVAVLCVLACAVCHADVIKGRVVNAETGEPIMAASINGVVRQQSGTYSVGVESDSIGVFYLNTPCEGRIVMSFSMIGYKVAHKVDYGYGSEVRDTTDIGEVRLQPTELMLQEVEVTAHIPRFTMSGDTIVFNPHAFKLKEGARLDELIKKLPGVQNRDGKLYWNDKPIRLMINGKDLFGGSAVVGELPAEVASKMKLYDRKSDLARRSGHDDGDEDNVLDIQVKPGFLDKWYGEVEAGYVTNDRYAGSITANRLSDRDPQMVYAQANRENRYFDRSMYYGRNSNIAGDGKSQYGSYNYQHNWQTKNAGSNNYFNVGVNFGHSDGVNRSNNTVETFFPNSERTYTLFKDNDFKHMLAPKAIASLRLYADANNLVTINVDAGYEKNRVKAEERSAMYGYEPGKFIYHSFDEAMAARPGDNLYNQLVNRSHRYEVKASETKKINAQYEWTHFLGKKGSFNVSGYTLASAVDNTQNVKRSLEYLREGRSETVMQSLNAPNRDVATALRASLNYWLTDKVYIDADNEIEYRRNRKTTDVLSDTYSFTVTDGVPTSIDSDNAMRGLLHQIDVRTQLGLTINPSKQVMLMPKLKWVVNRENMTYRYGVLDTAAIRINHIVQPSLLMRWKINRENNMDMTIAYDTETPDIESTMGYTNTLDPLWIYQGNPNLKKSHTFSAKYGYNRLWLRRQIMLGVSASYKNYSNPVKSMYSYNTASGVYVTKPMNVRGGDLYELKVIYDHGLGAFFRLANQIGVSRLSTYGYMTLVNDNMVPELSHGRVLGVNDMFEFSYETENLLVKAYNVLDWQKFRYNESSYNSSILYEKYGVSVYWNLSPVRLSFDIADQVRSGYTVSDMNRHRLVCSASASYTFCKNKCRVELSAEDIFNNSDLGTWTNISAYQRSTYNNYYFHDYFKLSFNYSFGSKSKKSSSKPMQSMTVVN